MSKVGISVMVEQMPEEVRPEYKCRKLIDRVHSAIKMVESGHDSRAEWKFLRRLNNKLHRLKRELTRSERNILKMIQPVMDKHGWSDPTGVEKDLELINGDKENG